MPFVDFLFIPRTIAFFIVGGINHKSTLLLSADSNPNL